MEDSVGAELAGHDGLRFILEQIRFRTDINYFDPLPGWGR